MSCFIFRLFGIKIKLKPFNISFIRIFVLNFIKMNYEAYQLENGIRVVHHRVGGLIAHVGLLINTGSRDEKEKEHGLAHLIEHMVFKGTGKRKAFHILSRLEDVGAQGNDHRARGRLHGDQCLSGVDRARGDQLAPASASEGGPHSIDEDDASQLHGFPSVCAPR